VSTDKSGTVHDQAPRDDRQQSPERAGGQQPSRAEAERQPAETRSRAEYNAARHAEPPIRRQGDPGQSLQADRQLAGSSADRRAEHAATGKAAEAETRTVRQVEAPTRTEYNAARHAAPPIEQPASPQAPLRVTNEGLASERTADALSDAQESPQPGQAGPETVVPEGAARGDDSGMSDRPENSETGQSSSGAGDQTRRDGTEAQYSWLSVAEADRTLGDTTPTGIGLKPTGEQLRDMESDDPSRSRLDRLLDRALDRADDIHDSAGETAESITAFRHPDPAISGHQAYTGHVTRDHPQPQGQPVNDMVGSTVVVAVAALAGLRHWIEHRRKEHEP
jgi:hypothetical protein